MFTPAAPAALSVIVWLVEDPTGTLPKLKLLGFVERVLRLAGGLEGLAPVVNPAQPDSKSAADETKMAAPRAKLQKGQTFLQWPRTSREQAGGDINSGHDTVV